MLFTAPATTGLLRVLGLLIGLAGCSSLTSTPNPPNVQLVKIDILKARLLEQQFILRFRVDNPDWPTLLVRGLDYEIFLSDVSLTKGKSSHWLTVPAHGNKEFDVLVTTNLWRHMKSIVKVLRKSNHPVQYYLRGKIKTGLLLWRKVPVSYRGDISIASLSKLIN
ncbi:LEA type 2 family protein [Azotobacter beijerinckii]|uniref:LEA type 2 family protein n=1 Tax=Azotobacter beijerinckii TaxID=170623 RepID=UPI000B8909E8|nr:LEA type 2 family protein [Azotobacter beijerinckii]